MAKWYRIVRLAEKNFSANGSLQVCEDEELLKQKIDQGHTFRVQEITKCNEQIAKWSRINRMIPKIIDLMLIEILMVTGDEDGIREHIKRNSKTRKELVEEARVLNVPYYGRLSKRELEEEIRRYKEHQIDRQRYERKS